MATEMKTFILGLGAQKAGTTWLYDYLSTSGRVATQRIKEYHVWDALHIPGMGHERVRDEDAERSFSNRIRHFLQQSPENYFTYFAYMMSQQAKSITCDITPIYAGLDRNVLDLIKTGFAQRGIVTKAVFLMRDPVERCWSAARMESRNESGHTRVAEEEVVARALSRLAEIRTRYDKTVGEIEAVFAPCDRHLGLYEEMFSVPNLAALSAFCGVPQTSAQAERKVNVSEVAVPLGNTAAKQIAAHYRDVYDFAARRFPQTLTLWPGFKYL